MSKKFNTIYNHASPVSPHGGKSLTDQQYRDECDIEKILKRFGVTGQLPPNTRGNGVSGDFSNIGDFQNCLDRINRAKDEFNALPSQIRDRFGNDPAAYVDFVLDPQNTEECVRLGLKEVHQPAGRSAEEILESIDKKVTPAKPGEGAA